MTKQTANLPSHRIYAVTNEGKQKFWSAIEAAWAHKDGDGFSLKLDYLPLIQGAQIVLRNPRPKRLRRRRLTKPRSRQDRSARGGLFWRKMARSPMISLFWRTGLRQ
jgi:hypothetical protein